MKLLILAVSYKNGGLCVAGVNLDDLQYVRIGYPKENECAAIPPYKFKKKTANGETQLKVLDVLDVDVEKMDNNGCQSENYWLKKVNSYGGVLSLSDIDLIYSKIEKKDFIFSNNFDWVNNDDICSINNSLQFVKVNNFTVSTYMDIKGNLKLKASFYYNEKYYNNIRVTDSVFSAYPKCYGNNQKTCNQQKAYIMVSLPYDKWSIEHGRFYKYVAGIILI